MRLYSGMSEDFIRDTTRNRIAERLREAFLAYYRYQPSRGEVSAWRNSLRAMRDVLDIAALHDHGVPLPVSGTREGDIKIAPPPSIVDPDATGRSRCIGQAAITAIRAATGV